ncbi:helix-turn-helix domain-containing protein [Fluviicola taffensis]|uniref:Helix-turn-helix domain protein n=1 Tax=Fluviicola taffensis (strain DSM 16823 / NCIMB 13979 / RW262) TaxID=755732 RepID=F2IJW9_FLUTR|nr:helix-turn-helix transcriptional regulator [Fluviicola taffensis]AEA45028.1 helix-turn-helix domain protein [Fluviicola taffensis DSM 16823]
MRSEILQEILDETPKDVEIFVRWYADIIKRINQILTEKGMSQKELAESLDKKPSEISKWLNGEHNFTLRSLAKLQAELGEELIQVPSVHVVDSSLHKEVSFTVWRNRSYPSNSKFEKFNVTTHKSPSSRVS